MKLTVQEIQEWLTQFAEAINQNKQYLSDLDTPIGDGDHGNNMGRGVSESSPQSCVKVQPHQKHNVLRCEPNCHAFLSEERGQEQ